MKGIARVSEHSFDLSSDSFSLSLPKGSMFLFFQMKGTVPQIFFQEGAGSEVEIRNYIIVSTSRLISKDLIVSRCGIEKAQAKWVFSYFDKFGNQKHVFEVV